MGLEGSEQGEGRRGGQRGDGWGVRADCGGPHGLGEALSFTLNKVGTCWYILGENWTNL